MSRFDRFKLVAGKGVAGANGHARYDVHVSHPGPALTGNDAAGSIAGGAVKQYTCPAGDTTMGGAWRQCVRPPSMAGDGSPSFGAGHGGKAGQACNCSDGGGLDGNPRHPPKAPPHWRRDARAPSTSTGWSPSSGSGGNGSPAAPVKAAAAALRSADRWRRRWWLRRLWRRRRPVAVRAAAPPLRCWSSTPPSAGRRRLRARHLHRRRRRQGRRGASRRKPAPEFRRSQAL